MLHEFLPVRSFIFFFFAVVCSFFSLTLTDTLNDLYIIYMGGVNQIISYVHAHIGSYLMLPSVLYISVCLSLADAYIFSSFTPACWINRVHKHSPIRHPYENIYTNTLSLTRSHSYRQIRV